MSSVAIITARGGSKRIPRKNIKEFMGKPMLAYAIEAALKSELFDEVMVSTDDKEIAEIAEQYGAKVPFMRSEKTANDFAGTEDVLAEVLSEYKTRGKHFNEFCCIYPCVPFLTPEILKQANRAFYASKADSLLPVVRYSFPIQRAFIVKENSFLAYREPECADYRTQDLETTYHDVGMFYFADVKKFVQYNNLIMPQTAYIELDESVIQDIDTMEDWKMAEIKYKILHAK